MKEYVKGLKFWLERARGYALWLNIFLLFDIWRVQSGYSWGFFFVVGIPSLIVLLYVDYKWIFPGEAASSTRANPEWNVLLKKIDALKTQVERLQHEKTDTSKSVS